MYVFVKKKFIDVENTNDPINAFSLNSGWPDDINGKVFKQNAESLCAELIEFHPSFPKAFFARYEWCLTTGFIASVFVEHKIAIKLMKKQEWDELSVIFDDAGLIWSSGYKCTEHTPTFLKSRLKNDGRKDPVTVHSSMFYGDRKLAVDVVSCLPEKFKVMSHSEFIDYCYEKYNEANYFVYARGCGKSLRVANGMFDKLADGKAIEPVGFKGGKRPSIFSENSKPAGLDLLNDAFEEMRKNVHQGLVDSIMNQPYDIHISSDGKTTTAKFYVNGKVVREAEAKCHPEDRFNFHTGAEVAFDRLWEKKQKLDLKNLKAGDKVRVKKDLKVGHKYGADYFSRGMSDVVGRIATIEEVHEYHDGIAYYLVEDASTNFIGNRHQWTPEMLEHI